MYNVSVSCVHFRIIGIDFKSFAFYVMELHASIPCPLSAFFLFEVTLYPLFWCIWHIHIFIHIYSDINEDIILRRIKRKFT